MCLIAVSPKGTQKYSNFFLDAIRKASITNTDGIGYTFKRNGSKNKVWISKGFKDVEKFINCLKHKRLKDDDELIVHLRIGNKGAKTVEMNHPFVLSENPDIILSNDCYVEYPTMCHNGTLYSFGTYNSLFSDTYFFVKDFMYIPEFQQLLKRDVDLFKEVFKTSLGLNRLAFIFNGENPIVTLGKFEEDQGYLFSNESYKNVRARNVGGTTIHYPQGPYSEYDEWDGDSWVTSRERIRKINEERQIGFSANHTNRVDKDVLERISETAEETQRNWRADNHTSEDSTTESESRNSWRQNAKKGRAVSINKPNLKAFDGMRIRNAFGNLEADPKLDIIPARRTSCFDHRTARSLYQHFNGALWVPMEYLVSQFNESKFVPSFFNYKHFTLHCNVAHLHSLNTKSLVVGRSYYIEDYDTDSPNPTHQIVPYEGTEAEKYANCGYITETQMLTGFTVQPKEEYRMVYLQVFKLMRMYDQPSKNNFTATNKIITVANIRGDSDIVTYKKAGKVSLTALKIYNNYIGMTQMTQDEMEKYYHRVQSPNLKFLVN